MKCDTPMTFEEAKAMLGIVDSKPIKMTNEEWFNGLATEEKAKRIINIAVNSDCDYRTIVEWLKQTHTPKE